MQDNKAEHTAETRAVCQLPEDYRTENQSGCLVPSHYADSGAARTLSGARSSRWPARWCLLVLVVEVRVRVTAPAKFWQRRRGFQSLAFEDRRSQQPGPAHAAPKIFW